MCIRWARPKGQSMWFLCSNPTNLALTRSCWWLDFSCLLHPRVFPTIVLCAKAGTTSNDKRFAYQKARGRSFSYANNRFSSIDGDIFFYTSNLKVVIFILVFLMMMLFKTNIYSMIISMMTVEKNFLSIKGFSNRSYGTWGNLSVTKHHCHHYYLPSAYSEFLIGHKIILHNGHERRIELFEINLLIGLKCFDVGLTCFV